MARWERGWEEEWETEEAQEEAEVAGDSERAFAVADFGPSERAGSMEEEEEAQSSLRHRHHRLRAAMRVSSREASEDREGNLER